MATKYDFFTILLTFLSTLDFSYIENPAKLNLLW